MSSSARKKPPSDEGGGICEANDGGRDRAAWQGAPGRGPGRLLLALRANSPSRALRRGYVVLLAPSSGPSGHLPPCGGKAKGGASRRPPLRCIWSLHPVGADLCVRPGPPCERGLSPPQGGDWGIPLTGNALYVVPSSVTASGRATFPPGGRLGRRGQAPALRVCVARRGRCPHRPAGGHIGPPLQKFRSVVICRGGPACPPSRSGRTHRCAPTRITNALHGAYSVGPDDPAGRGPPSGRALRWCVFP